MKQTPVIINGKPHVRLVIPATDVLTALYAALSDYFKGEVASNSYAGTAWVFKSRSDLSMIADTRARGGHRLKKPYNGQSFVLTAPFGALSALGRATARQFKEEDQ